MKKLIKFALLLFVIALLFPSCGKRKEKFDGFAYKVNDDKVSCTVSGLGNISGSVISIPKIIDGYIVTEIGSAAFENCKTIEKIDLPESVMKINEFAFSGCGSLAKIVLPEKLTEIGRHAFSGCVNLDSIIIPNGVKTIKESAFENCYSLKQMYIPDSVEKIESHIFDGCISLKSIELPFMAENDDLGQWFGFYEKNGTTYAGKEKASSSHINGIGGDGGYYIPDSLNSVTIKSGVIGYGALANFSNLTSITIGNRVTKIDDYAFYMCKNLEKITFQDKKEQWDLVSKGFDWNKETGNYTIYCTDEKIQKEEWSPIITP